VAVACKEFFRSFSEATSGVSGLSLTSAAVFSQPRGRIGRAKTERLAMSSINAACAANSVCLSKAAL
jgi:hypothetical protein